MKSSYTVIYYKNTLISNIFSVTLENDFYIETLIGGAEILEEKVPGRDIPYFYGISREPLEFEATFAFKKALTKEEIKVYVDSFLSNSIYQPLSFGELNSNNDYIQKTPVYNVIVTGDPEIEYIGVVDKREDSEGDEQLIDAFLGYFKLNFRCNAPYGFEEGEITNLNKEEISPVDSFELDLSRASLASNYYIITIKNESSQSFNDVKIENTTNETSLEFSSLEKGEIITVDGRNKRISTNLKEVENPYLRWNNRNEDFIILEPSKNEFEINKENIKITIKYEVPRFI